MADVRFTAVPVALQSGVQQAERSFHRENMRDIFRSERLLLLLCCLCVSGSRRIKRSPHSRLERLLPKNLYQCEILEVSICRCCRGGSTCYLLFLTQLFRMNVSNWFLWKRKFLSRGEIINMRLILVCGASSMFFYSLNLLSQFVNLYRYRKNICFRCYCFLQLFLSC